ncbi:uncharacterized protein LOC115918438 [Strongylocentrotus purpuratus]|uniref:Death domain-containing protein n=1 Tax=Strongylocentrotus purpuratus TaxID=7668 RepID=A0A7M7NCG9_STRPU|nr:uncharacterized protein LOC115918438 [Strongylocentrotus purpuratus]
MSVYTYAVPDSHHEPKVLLIGTFAGDEGPEIIGEKVKDKFQELKKQLGSKPYWKQVLFPMCGIDNRFSQGSEVNKIQDRIDGLVKDSAYMKVLMPIKWRTFLTEIEDSDRNTLTVTEAHSTMKTLGINHLKEVYAILKFYHDIGHLIYHEGCELIVLKPQFLNSIVSNIITVMDDKTMEEGLAKYWRDLMEKGILSIELIEAVWEQHKGDHDQLDDIIEMMITFDLICEIPDRPDGRGFFVPCRSSPMLDDKECHGKDDEVKFTIDFNHFLPDGFLHRFYVRMAKWSMERKESIKPIFHCRQMVFYIDNRHRVVMTNEIQSKERHQIKVTIYAVTPAGAPSGRTKARVSLNENIIDHIHKTLEELKQRWARRIEYSVGILCPECSKSDVKALIPILDILKCPEDSASCDEQCSIYVGDIQKAFNKDIGTTITTAESQAAGVSTLSEIDSESAEHYPRRTLPPSAYPQEHVGFTDTVHQFSQTHGEGSSSQSRPYKRPAPSTQSRVLQDDPEIPKKQSKNDLESDRKLNKLSKYLPHGTYTMLCTYLGIGYTEADSFLAKFNMDYQRATRHCLAQWKTRTGGNMDELETFLKDAEVEGLVKYIK